MTGDRVADMLSPHFQRQEFACRCGCGVDAVDPELVAGLERLRYLAGNHPLVITSGRRCAAHNLRVGGSPRSRHLDGLAADVAAPRGVRVADLYLHARVVPAFRRGGIGVYPDRGFVHVDVRLTPARWAQITDDDGAHRIVSLSDVGLPR